MPRQTRDLEPNSSEIEPIALRVLGKLASILLRVGLDAPRAEYLLRCALVYEAAKTARRPGRRITQSQIALLAGVNRLDVRKILESQHGLASRRKSKRETRIQRILTAWHHDPEFSNGRGRPKSLSFTGEGNQFEKLVRKYGRDITARTLRDNLTRNNLVITKKGCLIVNSRRTPGGARITAALSDLGFLYTQLAHFEFETVRRTFVTREVTLPARDAKLLKLTQRKAISKLETALKSLEAFKQTADHSKATLDPQRHRLRIVTIFSSETRLDSSRKN